MAESCRDGYRSIDPYWVVERYGRLAGYRLDIEDQSISVGETLVATLENVSGETNTSGNKGKFDIHYRDADRGAPSSDGRTCSQAGRTRA